jgi:hypothetical protein
LGLDDEIQQRRSRRSPIHSRADAPVHGRLVVVRRQDEVRPARRALSWKKCRIRFKPVM